MTKDTIIKSGIANKDILVNKENIDKIYVQISAKFSDDIIDFGDNLVLPKGETIEILKSPRLLVFGTLLEKDSDAALIAIAIFERVGEDQFNEIDKVDVSIEGLKDSIKSMRAEYSEFEMHLVASFDELTETKLCYDSNCLKNH